MRRIFRNKKAQNTAEYAILIAFVIAAAMAIQTYVKRGLQGRVHDSVRSFIADTQDSGSKFTGATQQYEPYYLAQDFTTTQDSVLNVEEQTGGGFARTGQAENSDRTGTMTYTAPIFET